MLLQTTYGEAKVVYVGRTMFAAHGAVGPEGDERVIYDGTHQVGVNPGVRVRDQNETPLHEDLAAILGMEEAYTTWSLIARILVCVVGLRGLRMLVRFADDFIMFVRSVAVSRLLLMIILLNRALTISLTWSKVRGGVWTEWVSCCMDYEAKNFPLATKGAIGQLGVPYASTGEDRGCVFLRGCWQVGLRRWHLDVRPPVLRPAQRVVHCRGLPVATVQGHLSCGAAFDVVLPCRLRRAWPRCSEIGVLDGFRSQPLQRVYFEQVRHDQVSVGVGADQLGALDVPSQALPPAPLGREAEEGGA